MGQTSAVRLLAIPTCPIPKTGDAWLHHWTRAAPVRLRSSAYHLPGARPPGLPYTEAESRWF